MPPRSILRWLSLALLGGLVYALGRALLAAVRLGFPAFDWQWYLAITVALVGLAVCLAWDTPRRLNLHFGLTLILWLAGGYSGFGQDVRLHPGRSGPIPILSGLWIVHRGRRSQARKEALP